jgi:DNA helicase II / ATP-dependent DNA helicase PcrA
LRKPSSKNRVIIACAGSGKTTRLVTEALSERERRIVIITYTNANTREIGKRCGELNSGIPKHVDVMTWYGFLLRECARPYQRAKYDQKRIESLSFVNKQSARGIPETNTRLFYFADGDMIYSDKIARFVIECERESSGAVTARLGQIYTDVFIDEFQDLAGWDLEVVRMLLHSGIRVTLVGDPRQHIYSTNPSRKNKQYLGVKVIKLVEEWERGRLCSSENMNETYRCNSGICEFANKLWPGMAEMTPLRNNTTGHDGVFLVASSLAKNYIERFMPQVLRHNRLTNTYGCESLNFRLAKGLQFKRVLIVPTGPIKMYLESGALRHVEKTRDRLHVAVTRAMHSVAFVFDGESQVVPRRWSP